MGDVTVDLCGGTHVMNTYDIDSFALAGFESKGAGIYRFTGYTGEGIESMRSVVDVFTHDAQKSIDKANRIANENNASMIALPSVPLLMGSYRDILNYRDYLQEIQFLVKEFEKTLQDQKAASALEDLSAFDSMIQGSCLVAHVTTYPADIAKQVIDRLAEKVGTGTVFLVSEYNNQLLLLAKSNNNVHCGNLVKKAAQIAGGNGGGREDFAQAGAKDPSKVDEILAFVQKELSCES
jgi:alanyl-tRNA synthetase